MGTFTITQDQPDKNLWVYPQGDGCVTDLNPYGAATNYLCVDEIKDAYNDDVDYVYSSVTDLLRDLYSTPTSVWSGISGTINYIQVYARAKSYLYPQSSEGTYKIIMTLDQSGCSIFYKSPNLDLLTTYTTFNNVWSVNPSTAILWQWSDLDNWQFGIECSSPTLTDYLVSATFRPNAAGDKTNLHPWSTSVPHQPANYTCVDEVSQDEDDTIVFTARTLDNNTLLDDLYNLPNHTTEAGTIVNVTVFYWITGREDSTAYASSGVKIGGVEYWDTLHTIIPDYRWRLYSHTWTLNPNTSAAWTWANIDDLQAGVRLKTNVAQVECTQVYVVVKYYAALNPEIRTTQCYARINYDSTATCTLNKPLQISVDHERNLKMLNFWSGNRAVYDIARSGKTIVLTGKEYGSNACTRIQCIRDIGLYGADVETNGLGIGYDDTFKILSFGWKKITDKPLTYDWILEMEYSDL